MAVPPDIMAALGGGAPAAGPMGGEEAIPPDIAALLGGGAPAEEEAPAGALHGGGAAAGDPEDFYRTALDELEQGVKADTDEARINVVMQCMTKIQGELAKSQGGLDGMMAGKMDAGSMRRMGAADEAY